ncbi:MAG: hypothetical protein ABI357_08485 [Granulicella sp.]
MTRVLPTLILLAFFLTLAAARDRVRRPNPCDGRVVIVSKW